MTRFYLFHLFIILQLHQISVEEKRQLEIETRGQGNNDRWKQARSVRITSSNFGTICKATEKRDIEKLVNQLISMYIVSEEQ